MSKSTNAKELKFLKKYIKTPSPVGYEVALGGQGVWTEYIKSVCPSIDIKLDSYGTAFATYTNWNTSIDEKNLKTVIIDAHVDEIAFHVTDITKDGYLKVGTLGGSDITIAPSARANVWTFGNTQVPRRGVFGHPAIHVHRRDFEASPENVFIDLGVSSKEEVEKLGVEIGNPITMEGTFEQMGDYYCGRALDDKIGGFITSKILKQLYDNNVVLDYKLIVVNAVQEEVGLYGARMAAANLDVDMAIAIDVCHCTNSPAYNVNKHGSTTSGKGPVIMTGPSLHNTLTNFIVDTAKKSKIDFQRTSSGGSSGTNADSYAYSKGTPTALLKLALKYMHTTVELVHKDDVDETAEVLFNTITSPSFTQLHLNGNRL